MLTMLWLVACGRSGDTPAPDSARTFTAAARGGRTYPGALTKPIDAYSGDELYELTSGLRYAGSHERARRCRGSAECDRMASVKRTLVQVSAVATQDSLGAGDLPEFGVVHVRAINRGDAEEARYGMRPGGTLRYYLIVQPDSAGAMRWRLEELQTASPRRHVQVAAGSVRGCGHRWKAGARADFKSCEQADRTDTVMTLPLALQTEFEAPIWFECDMGCCVSER
jgi:hypothetical protein